MATLLNTALLGLEQIQRAALVQLIANTNDYIAQVEEFMTSSDIEVATLTGMDYVPTEIERIAQGHFYEGHRPSLISAPVTNYPNLAVMAFQAQPGSDGELDQFDTYTDQLVIEIMVKAIENEEIVNRRIQRTAEAVNMAIMVDTTLGGVVTGFEGPPSLDLTDVFTRKEKTSYGSHWYWQGARIEYAVRKEAVRPTPSGGSIFRSANRPQPMDYSQFIDQG